MAALEETTTTEVVTATLEKNAMYPLDVLYCGVCGLPPELCEYNTPADFEKCKPWLREHVPDMYPDLKAEEELEKKMEDVEVTDAKESKKKGGGKKKVKMEPEVLVQKSQRKGRKQVTVVYGLDLFGVKIQDAAKVAKKKFSCGASLVKAPDMRDTLEIQGDRVRAVAQFLRDDFNLPENKIYSMDENKQKVFAFGVPDATEEAQ